MLRSIGQNAPDVGAEDALRKFKTSRTLVVIALLFGLSLFVCILLSGIDFFRESSPGTGVKFDICSDTPDNVLGVLIGAVGLFVGLPISAWAIVRAMHPQKMPLIYLAVLALVLDLSPLPVGVGIDYFVIAAHPAGVTSNADCGY